MKKSLCLILLQLVAATAFAAQVTLEKAQSAAERYIESRTGGNFTVKSSQAVDNAFYIVNFAPKGWVIVAADDVVTPIIGYSLSGSLDMNLIPENAKYFINSYKEQIKYIVKTEKTAHSRWENVEYATSRAGESVEPLIKVHWNQTPPYNAYCPRQTALVGCVAVAMSQAMSVQRYPSRPTGSVSYSSANYGRLSIDFDSERAYNWDDILSGANRYDEAARLMMHAGYSVKMDYGEEGSGIPSNQVSRISNALKNNFGYSDDVRYYWRDQYSGDWSMLIRNEINAGRAVIYNALDSKGGYGHSFNLDGYDSNGLFNVNWGWGGHGDGYFSINSLRDSQMDMNYDTGHVVVVGIGGPDQPIKSISLSHNKIEENLPAGSVVGAIMVNGEPAQSNHRLSVRGAGGSSNVPFKIEDGMLKSAKVLTTADKNLNVEITVRDTESGAELTQGFNVEVEAWASLEEKTQLSYDRITGMFRVVTKHNVSYSIYDANGTLVQSGELAPLPELEFNTAILPAGKNRLELRSNDEIKNLYIVTK